MKNKKLIFSILFAGILFLNTFLFSSMKKYNSKLYDLFSVATAQTEFDPENPFSDGNCVTQIQIVKEERYECFGDYAKKYYAYAAYACGGPGPGTCMHGWFETTIYCNGSVKDKNHLNTNATCGN